MYGVSLLGGIGFIMSIFIANLAYQDIELIAAANVGIVVSSLFAGLAGWGILRLTTREHVSTGS